MDIKKNQTDNLIFGVSLFSVFSITTLVYLLKNNWVFDTSMVSSIFMISMISLILLAVLVDCFRYFFGPTAAPDKEGDTIPDTDSEDDTITLYGREVTGDEYAEFCEEESKGLSCLCGFRNPEFSSKRFTRIDVFGDMHSLLTEDIREDEEVRIYVCPECGTLKVNPKTFDA